MADTKHNTFEETIEKTRSITKKPPLFKVFLMNDDYTTMEFVVYILEEFFQKASVEAVQIMLHVHKNGKGLAGIYTKDIAQTKVSQVHSEARKRGFPLKCSVERE
ncbi:MAG: ATP-dependent Clp protease adapter ClpS [Candidatus Riflebacteria bacterium]|nr:ATP-dependent Clp protease adapter ClpS [Candidatus Riflebacteria bacterium]